MTLALIRAGVDRVLGYLADGSLSYRLVDGGAWLPFPGGILNTDTPTGMVYDEDEAGEVQMQTGLVVARITSPALEMDNQFKDIHGQGWVVLGVDRSVAAVMYRVRRMALSDEAVGPARGGKER